MINKLIRSAISGLYVVDMPGELTETVGGLRQHSVDGGGGGGGKGQGAPAESGRSQVPRGRRGWGWG